VNVTISGTEKLSATLRRVASALHGSGRMELHQAMGAEVQYLTEDYLRAIAAERHKTADSLGASPSNHLAQAAEKVAQPGALTADADAATLTINHPGMVRAFRDVTIRPINAKALCIPINAIAYNRRPAQLWDQLKLFIPKGTRFIAMKTADGKSFVALYVMVRSVTQSQDRSLLPSNDQFGEAAARGARRFIGAALQKGGNL